MRIALPPAPTAQPQSLSPIKLVGTGAVYANQGISVALSADGNTAISGATLTVNPPALQVTPTTNIAASGTQGGPFSPSSFSYTLSAANGSATDQPWSAFPTAPVPTSLLPCWVQTRR